MYEMMCVLVIAALFTIPVILIVLLVKAIRKKPLKNLAKVLLMVIVLGFIGLLGMGALGGDDEPQASEPPQVSETPQKSEPPQVSETPQASETPQVSEPPVEDEPVFSEEEALALLKADADLRAIGSAETLVRSMLYDPTSAVFYDEEILDSDDYLRYVVKLTVNATNALGGRIDNTYVCNFRIYSEDTSRFTYNEMFGVMEYDAFAEEYRPEDWGMEPEDFTLEPAQLTPESVSLKTLLANAADYNGKYVVITDDLRVLHNDLENRIYSTRLSTGPLFVNYDSSFSLNIYYSYLDDANEWAELSTKDCPAIRAEGIFRIYENKQNTGYLEAKKLELK